LLHEVQEPASLETSKKDFGVVIDSAIIQFIGNPLNSLD